MAKWVTGSGYAVDKGIAGPAHFSIDRRTTIMVDLDDGERVNVLLISKDVGRVAIGDYVSFEYKPGKKPGFNLFGKRKGICRNLKIEKRATEFYKE